MSEHVYVVELVAKWQKEADLQRHRGQEAEATRTESFIVDLTAAEAGFFTEVLNLREASRESGYSGDHLGRMVRDGKIPNVGRRNAPKVLRKDLPRKAPLSPITPVRELSREQIVRSVTKLGVR